MQKKSYSPLSSASAERCPRGRSPHHHSSFIIHHSSLSEALCPRGRSPHHHSSFIIHHSSLSEALCPRGRSPHHHSSFIIHHSSLQSKARFTLIEIIMVIALIAVLTGIAVGGYSYANGAAKESATKAVIKQLEAALESCKVKHGFYPSKQNFNMQLLKADGSEETDANLATAWGGIPENYIKDFRKALDFESLREYINNGVVCDAWGEPLIYTAPDTTNKRAFTIRSKGPDGEDGTDDQKKDDIKNYEM